MKADDSWARCLKSLRLCRVASQRAWEKSEEAYLLAHQAVEYTDKLRHNYDELQLELCGKMVGVN